MVLRSPSIPKTINRNKSKLAIVPNIIHSLDSTHLNFIVREFINLDLPIVTVHDCFVIHPNNWLFLRDVVIDKYIQLYSDENFLEKYHNSCIELFKSKYE